MTGVAVTPLLLFSAALYFSYAVEGYPRICAFNRANAVNNEKKCKYGWEMDPCGTKLCTKGNMNIPAESSNPRSNKQTNNINSQVFPPLKMFAKQKVSLEVLKP